MLTVIEETLQLQAKVTTWSERMLKAMPKALLKAVVTAMPKEMLNAILKAMSNVIQRQCQGHF